MSSADLNLIELDTGKKGTAFTRKMGVGDVYGASRSLTHFGAPGTDCTRRPARP
jgi:hypothetical protein